MKFGVKSSLFFVAIISAFMAGWVMPPPLTNEEFSPVILANREIGQFERISASDLRTVLMPKTLIPNYAARDVAQVTYHFASRRIRADSFVFVDEIDPPTTLISKKHPVGRKAVLIALPQGFNPLALNLMAERDVVSLHLQLDGNAKCIVPKCSVCMVFHNGRNDHVPTMISLFLDEGDAKKVEDHQNAGFKFFVDIPKLDELSNGN